MLKAPFYTLEWKVNCKENKEVEKYVEKTLKLFWKPNIAKVLRAMEFGFACGELSYVLKEDGKWWLGGYKEFHPRDVRVLTYKYNYEGFRVKTVVGKGDVEIFPPEAFWFAIDKQFGNWYGRSYLINIWEP